MANNIDLVISSTGEGIVPGGSAPLGILPSLYRNDRTNFRLRLVNLTQYGIYSDTSYTSPTFSLGIGNINEPPEGGEFKLTTSTGTSPAIAYNATTTQILNAVSGIAGNVSVSTFGSLDSSYLITAATENTALSFTGSSFTLFPTSTVEITTKQTPASGIKAAQVIQLRQDPFVSVTGFATASTANAVSFFKIQDGAASPTSLNETYKLLVTGDAIGGSLALAYGANSTCAIAITNINQNDIAAKLAAVSGLSANTINVSQNQSQDAFVISFVGALGQQNITTALTLDSGGVLFNTLYEKAVTISSLGIDNELSKSSNDVATLTLEIEMTASGNRKTILQEAIEVKGDLLND